MPQIQHSVQIARPPAEVFAVTNDIDNWRVLFNEYNESEVLRREEAGRFTKLVFRLRNKEGAAWQSWRLLDHQDLVAVAQREDPLHPFLYMHLTWTYRAVDGGTLMTWTQDFELDPALELPLATVVARMDAHGRDNQVRIKGLIESGAVVSTAGSTA
ncbi:MAG: aromatase [Micromonosporaceae bacterium]|jgi:aromatase